MMKLLLYFSTLILSSQVLAQADHEYHDSMPYKEVRESSGSNTDSIHLSFSNSSLDKLILEGNLPINAHLSLLSPGNRELIQLFPKKIANNRYRLFAAKTELDLLSPGLYYVCIEENNTQIIPWLKG